MKCKECGADTRVNGWTRIDDTTIQINYVCVQCRTLQPGEILEEQK